MNTEVQISMHFTQICAKCVRQQVKFVIKFELASIGAILIAKLNYKVLHIRDR